MTATEIPPFGNAERTQPQWIFPTRNDWNGGRHTITTIFP